MKPDFSSFWNQARGMRGNLSEIILSIDAPDGMDFVEVMPDVPKLAERNPRLSGPRRVLVADDGRNAAEILAMFFQLEGMETAVAYDGLDAVGQAETFDPHLVCMDLTMPVMDGYEAARKIRERKKDVILVAISGWDGAEERRRTEEAGFDFYMVKPVRPGDLRTMLARFLIEC